MSQPQPSSDGSPKFGCFWTGLLVLLVLALIGYGMCSQM
jgi:hypothetical protein